MTSAGRTAIAVKGHGRISPNLTAVTTAETRFAVSSFFSTLFTRFFPQLWCPPHGRECRIAG